MDLFGNQLLINFKGLICLKITLARLCSIIFLVLVFIYDSMNLVSPRKDGEPSLEQLMKSLKSNIDSRRGKNVDILLISEEVKLIILCLF